MWKEHIALHLHVKNSVWLHQAEAWMISFFDIENDQDIINNVAQVVGVLGDKKRKPHGPTRDQNVRKEQWTKLYSQKSDEEFS